MSAFTEIDFFRFQERFQTEEQCFEHLKKLRWPNGFTCPRCGHTEAYCIEGRKLMITLGAQLLKASIDFGRYIQQGLQVKTV